MTIQTYSVAGFTTKDGVSKIRWTNNIKRQYRLFKHGGYSHVRLESLPKAMTKMESLVYLKDHPGFQEECVQRAIKNAYEYQTMVSAKANGTYVMKKRGRPAKKVITVDQIAEIMKEEA